MSGAAQSPPSPARSARRPFRTRMEALGHADYRRRMAATTANLLPVVADAARRDERTHANSTRVGCPSATTTNCGANSRNAWRACDEPSPV